MGGASMIEQEYAVLLFKSSLTTIQKLPQWFLDIVPISHVTID